MRLKAFCLAFFICSLCSAQSQIIGGHQTSPGNFPWMMALKDPNYSNIKNSFFCGGTLIRKNWVLTAAHCIEGSSPSDVAAILNAYILTIPDSNQRVIQSTHLIMHQSYNTTTLENDIGLIRLQDTVNNRPITLPGLIDTAWFQPGLATTLIGWGLKKDSLGFIKFCDTLLAVDLDIQSLSYCNDTSRHNGDVKNKMVCATHPQGIKEACYGDSGGPLFTSRNQDSIQVGIVSWGAAFCQNDSNNNAPSVFTNILHYRTWIDSVIAAVEASVLAGLEEKQALNNTFTTFTSENQTRLNLLVEPAYTQPFDVSIYDYAGKKLFQRFKTQKSTIDISSFTPGLYIVLLRQDNGKESYSKFIVTQ